MSDTPKPADHEPSRIALGIIRRAHGVRGEASVEIWTESAERFTELSRLFLVSPVGQSRPAKIESVRAHADRALIQFAGIHSPEDVMALQNYTLEIPEEDARELEENEYFLHDLIGTTLIDMEGRERGVVRDVYEGGGGVLLSVERNGRRFEVPFAADICVEIDLQSRRMRVKFPVGLDDLDAVED